MPLTGDPRLWKPWHKQGAIWAVLSDKPDPGHRSHRCPVCEATIAEVEPRIGVKPITFARKTRDGWVNLPLEDVGEQIGAKTRLRNLVYEIHAHASEWTPDAPAPEPTPEPPEPSEPEPTPEPTPTPEPIPGVGQAMEDFYQRVQLIRAFTRSRNGFDSLDSMRVIIDGAKAVKAGVPVAALEASLTATWQADSRAQLVSYRPTPADLKPASDGYDYGAHGERPHKFAHRVSAYVTTLVKAGVPVWLHGPAGTGKSTAAKAAADLLGLDYYEVNLAGAMASSIKGKDRLKTFITSEFERAYEFGGLICLEEFDAAHPTVATAINNAIAGDTFHNDANGRSIPRHPNFRIVATANTLGTGATKEFNGRMKLDGATLDRFRMGRVYVGLDLELERAIFDSICRADLKLAA